jgi:hypothetical protein
MRSAEAPAKTEMHVAKTQPATGTLNAMLAHSAAVQAVAITGRHVSRADVLRQVKHYGTLKKKKIRAGFMYKWLITNAALVLVATYVQADSGVVVPRSVS